MEHAIIIPSLNPGQELISLVRELIKMGADKIIIVNDGSDAAHAHIFKELKHSQNIFIIEHSTNLGKGAALKTAFTYCMEHFRDITGVITADSDGQHTPTDIFRMAEALFHNPDSLILGTRDFDKSTTPTRSYIGNRTTSRIFYFLYRIELSDTQTGLRGIPSSELEWMTKIRGQRYDYELNMLIQAKRRNIEVKQIPIEVIYFNENRGSHFKTVKDAMPIAKILIFNLFIKIDKGQPPYGKLFYFCRGFLRLFNKEFTVVGDPPAKPTVFIGHHQNLKGALNIMMWINIPVRIWMLKDFCIKGDCFDQFANYTFSQRLGWPKVIASAVAYVCSCFMHKLAKSMRAIPVYRDSIDALKITVNGSVEALCKNENILLFPDIDYTDESDLMGEMYTGFIHVDKRYYAKTGKHVDFVPVRINMSENQIYFGKPSCVGDEENYMQAKKRITLELQEAINS